MKTLADLLKERRPIEDQLETWMREWAEHAKKTGFDGDPFQVLRPIDEMVRERIMATPPAE